MEAIPCLADCHSGFGCDGGGSESGNLPSRLGSGKEKERRRKKKKCVLCYAVICACVPVCAGVLVCLACVCVCVCVLAAMPSTPERALASSAGSGRYPTGLSLAASCPVSFSPIFVQNCGCAPYAFFLCINPRPSRHAFRLIFFCTSCLFPPSIPSPTSSVLPPLRSRCRRPMGRCAKPKMRVTFGSAPHHPLPSAPIWTKRSLGYRGSQSHLSSPADTSSARSARLQLSK